MVDFKNELKILQEKLFKDLQMIMGQLKQSLLENRLNRFTYQTSLFKNVVNVYFMNKNLLLEKKQKEEKEGNSDEKGI